MLDEAVQMDWAKPFSHELLARVLLIFQCNAHEFYTEDDEVLFSLLGLASKATHSCAPNVFFLASPSEGSGSYVALRDIEPQEMILYAYLDVVLPTDSR